MVRARSISYRIFGGRYRYNPSSFTRSNEGDASTVVWDPMPYLASDGMASLGHPRPMLEILMVVHAFHMVPWPARSSKYPNTVTLLPSSSLHSYTHPHT